VNCVRPGERSIAGCALGTLDSKIKSAARENFQALQRIVQLGTSDFCSVPPPVTFERGNGISVESDISVKNLKETELECTYAHLSFRGTVGRIPHDEGRMNRQKQ
jgi:hypothetical protein